MLTNHFNTLVDYQEAVEEAWSLYVDTYDADPETLQVRLMRWHRRQNQLHWGIHVSSHDEVIIGGRAQRMKVSNVVMNVNVTDELVDSLSEELDAVRRSIRDLM